MWQQIYEKIFGARQCKVISDYKNWFLRSLQEIWNSTYHHECRNHLILYIYKYCFGLSLHTSSIIWDSSKFELHPYSGCKAVAQESKLFKGTCQKH